MIYGLTILAVAAGAWLWWLGRPPSAPSETTEPGRVWSFTDYAPKAPRRYLDAADQVEHSLDFATLRYRVIETRIQDDIAAESDTTVLRETFEARRENTGWRIRLVERNGAAISGEDWQDAPAEFLHGWDSAWRDWTAKRSRAAS